MTNKQICNVSKLYELKKYIQYDYSDRFIDFKKMNVKNIDTIITALQLYDFEGEKTADCEDEIIKELNSCIDSILIKSNYKYTSYSYIMGLPTDVGSKIMEVVKEYFINDGLLESEELEERLNHVHGSQLFEVYQSMSDQIDIYDYLKVANKIK